MSKERCKTISFALLLASVGVFAAHAVWYFIILLLSDGSYGFNMQSFLLNLLPYGLPILTFALVWRALKKEQSCWCMADTVLGALFSLSFIAMAVHITAAGIVGDFHSAYFNISIYYTIPFGLLGLVWLIVRMRPRKDSPLAGKILFVLPLAALAAMVIHCAVFTINGLIEGFGTSGAPWAIYLLIFAVVYVTISLLLLAVYAVYRAVLRRRQKKAAEKAEN